MKTIFSRFNWKDYELFFVLFFAWNYIVGSIAGIVRRFVGDTHSLDVLALDVVLLIIFINSVTIFFKRFKTWQLAAVIILFLVMILSSAGTHDLETHTQVWARYWTQCVPIFIFAGCVRDFEKVYWYMLVLMRIYPFIGFLAFYFFQMGSISEDMNYSAGMTYQYLLPAVVLVYDLIKKFSFRSLIPLGISVFMIFGFGSRGPLVSFFLAAILFIALREGTVRSKIRIIIPVVILAVFVVSRSEGLLNSMFGTFTNLNMSTRTITLMTDETLFEDDARSRITRIGMDRVMMNPVWGTGLVNDRIYIQKELNSSEAAHGWYPHNFFVELLMQFGCVLGLILLFYFFRLLFRTYKYSPSTDARAVLLIFIGAYFFPLMFSGSYLEWNGFYALMGICGAILTTSKQGVNV